jgi:hypothetical protein
LLLELHKGLVLCQHLLTTHRTLGESRSTLLYSCAVCSMQSTPGLVMQNTQPYYCTVLC